MLRISGTASSLLLILLLCLLPLTAQGKVDWDISNAIQLDETPLDVAYAQGGDLTFLLTNKAKVLIYSADSKLVGTVPVDPSVTDIAISDNGEKLYLINSERNTLQALNINFIVDFNVDDSPFMGAAGAKVVVAVFSDFQ